MSNIVPIIGILFVAAITPGPNNVIVMNAAIKGGVAKAGPLIVAIITGSLALYLLTTIGLGAAAEQFPMASAALAFAAASYLVVLGWRMAKAREPNSHTAPWKDISFFGVAVFQFMNPKSWVIMGVVASSTQEIGPWIMAVVMTLVFAFCLSLWAVAGAALANTIRNLIVIRRFNCVMGASLILFAGLIVCQQINMFAQAQVSDSHSARGYVQSGSSTG